MAARRLGSHRRGIEITPRETGLGESGVFYIVFPSRRPEGGLYTWNLPTDRGGTGAEHEGWINKESILKWKGHAGDSECRRPARGHLQRSSVKRSIAVREV